MGAARDYDFPQQTQRRAGRQGYRERFECVTPVWVGGGQPSRSLVLEKYNGCLNEKMRDNEVIRAQKGSELAKRLETQRGSFFRSWGRGCRQEAAADEFLEED